MPRKKKTETADAVDVTPEQAEVARLRVALANAKKKVDQLREESATAHVDVMHWRDKHNQLVNERTQIIERERRWRARFDGVATLIGVFLPAAAEMTPEAAVRLMLESFVVARSDVDRQRELIDKRHASLREKGGN